MGTHFNAYKTEVVEALAKAHEALAEAEDKFQALVEKLEADVAPVEPVGGNVDLVEKPVVEPVAKPATPSK